MTAQHIVITVGGLLVGSLVVVIFKLVALFAEESRNDRESNS